MDHLEQAKKFAALGSPDAENRAMMHALVDIAESLRTLRPPAMSLRNRAVHLTDVSLEAVVVDEDEQAS